MAQHGLLQPAQLRARLEPQLVDQRAARVGVGLERLGLATAAVEREHQLRAEPLPQRVACDERAQLRDQLGVAAEREVGVDAQLERLEPLLLERLDGRDGELLVGEVGERAAPPLAERCPQRLGGLARAAGREVVAALRAQRLEARDVGAPRGRAHAVAGGDGLDDVVRLEQPAQARDVLLQRGAASAGGASPHSSSISVSAGTTSPALSSSMASTLRWRTPPRWSGRPSSRTSSGPRRRKSRPRSTPRRYRVGATLSAA